MTFMITWSIAPAHQKVATTRFLKTGGGPPNGVEMLGRWHGAGIGWVLAKTDRAAAIYEWIALWTDALTFVVTPVIEDAEMSEVMRKADLENSR
jgi:hypothetical protein